MKRKIGTAVLFSMTILTIVAITHLDPPKNHAVPIRSSALQSNK